MERPCKSSIPLRTFHPGRWFISVIVLQENQKAAEFPFLEKAHERRAQGFCGSCGNLLNLQINEIRFKDKCKVSKMRKRRMTIGSFINGMGHFHEKRKKITTANFKTAIWIDRYKLYLLYYP